MATEEKRTLNMQMPTKLYQRIQKKAKQKNISMAALINLICTEYLEKN